MFAFRKRSPRAIVAMIVAAVILVMTGVFVSAQTGPSTPGAIDPNAGADHVVPSFAGVARPNHVTAKTYAHMPQIPSTELARVTGEELLNPDTGPNLPTPSVVNPSVSGPGQVVPSSRTQTALRRRANFSTADPTTFGPFQSTLVPTTDGSISGRTGEPSIDANGANIFQTGNWYAAYSHNNGANWTFLDPFSIFGSGFCCDQVTLYDPGRDVQFWFLQYDNHDTLAVSRGSDLTNWCSWNIDRTTYGLTSGDLDFNDMALTTNNLFITSNIINNKSASVGVLRVPIDDFAACGNFSYRYFTRGDTFTLKPVAGANETMYLGSNWSSGAGMLGMRFRVIGWADKSTSYTIYDRNVDPFTFFKRNSGQNCGSTDGVVANWCQYADSRVLAGALARGILVFGWAAKQDKAHPFPFVRFAYFKQWDNSIMYMGRSEAWSAGFAVAFPQIAPNARGHIGAVAVWGGGAKNTDGGVNHFYPGNEVIAMDDISPTQPWAYNFTLFGQGNPCQTSDNPPLTRWGDYYTIRPYHPASDLWIATEGDIEGNNCASGGINHEYFVIFGRQRDMNSYSRWNSSTLAGS